MKDWRQKTGEDSCLETISLGGVEGKVGPGKHSAGQGHHRRALQRLREECRDGGGSAVFAAERLRRK